jgi:hypothetical protein
MLHNMVHGILKELGGIQQYGVVSMCLFCLVFAGAIASVLCMKRAHADYMARVALDDGEEEREAEGVRASKRQSVERDA